MALNPALLSSDMLAIGSDSGVVNLYDDPATTGSSLTRQPTLRKAIMNLVSSLLLSLLGGCHVHNSKLIQLNLYQGGLIV